MLLIQIKQNLVMRSLNTWSHHCNPLHQMAAPHPSQENGISQINQRGRKTISSHKGVINEVFQHMKTTIEHAPNAITQVPECFKEENERVRQHEL